MEPFNLLSSIWKSKRKYCLIDEDILIESTFIQQTSKGENLWKAQLGATKNYIIFLRCDIELDNVSYHIFLENARLLLNMIPKTHLKIKNMSKRKLEIELSTGNVCYFKLLMCVGCGKAWSLWKNLGDINVIPLVPRINLILFSDLDFDTQKALVDEQFLICFFPYCKNLRSMSISETSDRSFSISGASDISKESESFTTFDCKIDLEKTKQAIKSFARNDKQEEKIKSGTEVNFQESEKTPNNCRRRKKRRRKTKQIKRFGEGIPENCVFDLTLSYSDEIVVKDLKAVEHASFKKEALKLQGSLTDFGENKYVPKIIPEKSRIVLNSEQNENFLTFSSILTIPNIFRRSKSVDAASEILATDNETNYLKHNISLPNLHEMDLHRRYNRLTYSVDQFSQKRKSKLEEHIPDGMSFWYPDKKDQGRIYCTTPICREILAYKEKLACTRQRKQFSAKRKINEWSSTKMPIRAAEVLCTRKNKTQPNITKSPTIETKDEWRKNSLARDIKCDCNSKQIRSSKDFLKVTELEPQVTAFELHRIQQQLFCQIETSELMRFVLKPHTVTEVNCPYLCGFLFFFERLESLTVAEILASKEVEDAAKVYKLFVKIALACFRRRDEQSAYAIISGLSHAAAINGKKIWNFVLEHRHHTHNLWYVLRANQQRKKSIAQQRIPFFLNFINFLVKRLSEPETAPSLTTKTESVWNAIKDAIYTSQTRNAVSEEKEKKNLPSSLISSYEGYGKVLNTIEDCRKYFFFENIRTKDNATREYLLYKQFSVETYINRN